MQNRESLEPREHVDRVESLIEPITEYYYNQCDELQRRHLVDRIRLLAEHLERDG